MFDHLRRRHHRPELYIFDTVVSGFSLTDNVLIDTLYLGILLKSSELNLHCYNCTKSPVLCLGDCIYMKKTAMKLKACN